MISDEAASPVSAWRRKKPTGWVSTYGRTFAMTKTETCGFSGSSVRMRADLEMGPWNAFVSMLRTIFPSAPGLIVLSYSGAVQPQEGFTSVT